MSFETIGLLTNIQDVGALQALQKFLKVGEDFSD
jgi:hypothetical protein